MKKIKLISTLAITGVITPVAALLTSCSCGSSASLSDEDKKFLNSINAVIEPLDFEGVPFKAVHAVKNAGYALFEHKFSNSNFELVLNMDGVKQYAILNNDVILTPDKTISSFNKNKVWKFVDSYDPKSEYAQHLNDNFKFNSNDTLEVTGSLDTGTNTNVTKIKYVGTKSEKECYLRTYTEFLTITPQADDTIHHFHYADNVFVTGTTSSHYLEYGRSCYLKAQNTKLSFALTQARDEPCTVDVFEPIGSNTVELVKQGDDTNIYSKMGSGTTKGVNLRVVYETTTETAGDITALQNAIKDKTIVRLSKDISLTYKDGITIGATGLANAINVVLDLNGHSITTSEDTDSPIINVVNGTLILIDSAGPDSTATISGTQHIVVAATAKDDIAKMIMDGGKIHFTTTNSAQRTGITVGSLNAKPTTANEFRSEFYMYGGSINCISAGTIERCVGPAIELIGKGTYMYSVYGNIYGTDGAVALGDEANTSYIPGETVGSELEVFGGNFGCDEKHICINLRRESKMTTYGGSFTGGTTIGCVNSQLNLHGGVYNATGVLNENFYKTGTDINNYLISDGSVIACYWHTDKSLTTGAATQPNIVANDVKMYSAHGNILHLGAEDLPEPSIKNWMEFISGCYYYASKAQHSECNAGMLFDTTTYKKFEWLQKGLWTARS